MLKQLYLLQALLVALLATCPLISAEDADTEEPAAPEPTAGADLPPIDWWAVNQSFVEDKGAIVLSGSAWIRYRSIKLQADHIVFFRETREAYAEGHIRLREGESELSAEVAYYDLANDRGYLIDATVKVSTQGSAMPSQGIPTREQADAALAKAAQDKAGLIKTKDPYGVYLDVVDDPQSRLNFVFHAERVVRESRYHHYAENAFLTTDEMADPMYGLKIGKLDLTSSDEPDPANPGQTVLKPKLVRGERARIKLGPMVLPPMPTISYDLTRPMPYVRFDYGTAGQWGYYGLSRIGWSLGGHKDRVFDPARMYVDADFRSARGPALGGEFRYKTGTRPSDPDAREILERGRGYVRVYGLWEGLTTKDDDLDRANRNMYRRQLPQMDGQPRRHFDANLLFAARRARDGAGPALSKLYQYREDLRYTVDFAHHQPLRHVAGLNDIDIDLRYQYIGDRDFVQEYFYNNYSRNNQPDAMASIRKAGDNYWAEILYRDNPQSYEVSPPRAALDRGSFTSYQPALTYSLMPFALPKGFYVSGEFEAAHLTREFDRTIIDQDELEANRLYGRASLQRPFSFWGLNFRPHVGGQIAAYDDSRDGGSTYQGAYIWGLDVSKRFYATFPNAINEELGVHGLRHIIEPRIEYLGISDTAQNPDNILDFDAVDDLQRMQRIRFSIEQLFQGGRHRPDGTFARTDVAGLNIWMDMFPVQEDRERLLEGAWTDLLYAEGFLNVSSYLRFTGRAGYSLADSRIETVNVFATLDPGGRWRVSVGERFNYTDKDRALEGSDEIYLRFEWQLSERWGFLYEQSYQRKGSDLDREGTQSQTIALTRRYGPLVGQLKYHTDKNFRNNSFGVSLAPAFAYRNLVVPTGDLLVDAVEVEGDAPAEERNFDPFDLIKKKKAKTAPKSAPPPPTAPSEPTTERIDTPSTEKSAATPQRPKPGADDWATY